MVDVIVIAIVVLIVGSAILYIRKAKKRGASCIGCPSGGSCGKRHGDGGNCGSCSCGSDFHRGE